MAFTSRPKHTQPSRSTTGGPPSGSGKGSPSRGIRRLWPGWRYAIFLTSIFALVVGGATVGALTFSSLVKSGSAGVSWRGDYETGDFDQWDCGVQEKVDGRATIVTSPVRQGKYAARFEVRPGDDNVAGSGNGERTEALSCRSPAPGEEQWWAWSTMFAPDFSASNSDWNIFTQFHNSGSTGGRVEFYVNGDKLGFTSHGGDINNPTARSWAIGNKENGKWYDFVFHVKWSSSGDGFVEVWLNGDEVVPLTNTPTFYVGQDVYLKQGYYRESQSNVGVIYDDGMRQGTSYADVAAEFGGSTTPEPAPTPEPTPEPTPAPTPEPTPAPTPEPTPAPTPEPTPTPAPEAPSTPAPGSTPAPAPVQDTTAAPAQDQTSTAPQPEAPAQPAPASSAGSPSQAPTLIPPPAPESVVPLESQPYVIEWSDRLFENAGEFRSYMIGRGIDWSDFVEKHPAVVTQGGLIAVTWDDQDFYDQASLMKRLAEHSVPYEGWAERHPQAATVLNGDPVPVPHLATAETREKRAVIRWSDIGFTSANGLRIYLTEQGIGWNAFLVRHPAAARRLSLASVDWNGLRFYTRTALSGWLAAHGSDLDSWDRAHPGFAEQLQA